MARNPAEQHREFPETAVRKRDSKQITDLIEQLERDLQETSNNAAEER